ncbi:MAG TPA: PucR family transcriptional regulator [Thermoanaerobacterales bacterium]|nr:PucR family transcriptional regulator [Thermoanaerobacterales bacterium]
MAITISEALKLDVFKDAVVVAGHEGLDNEIKWINILEILDEFELLHEGELLITTAFGLNGYDASYHEKIIHQLAKRKLAAVAIQTGYYLDEIPSSWIRLADDYKLPLIQIPQKISFSEINRAITDMLTHHDDIDLEYAQRINTILTDALLTQEGLHGITAALNRLTEHPIRILNYFYHAVSWAGMKEPCEESLEAEFNSMKEKGLIGVVNSLLRPYEITGMEKDNIPDQVLIPIRTSGEVYGYLSALKDGREFSKKSLIALTQGASLCSLDLMKEDKVLKTRHNYNQEFFKELISDNQISEKRLEYWHSKIPFPRGTSFSACVVESHDVPNRKILKKIANLIELFLSQKYVTGIAAYFEDEIIIMIFSGLFKKPESFRMFIKEMKENIEKYFDNMNVYIGVGSEYDNILDFKKSYDEAKKVVTCHMLSLKDNDQVFYKDLGLLRLLLEMHNLDALHSFSKDTIETLEEHDKNHSMNLVNSLRVFLKNLNINKASEELFIHRHTLKYRLNKIRELTDLDPNLPEHQFILNMGILVSDYLKAKKINSIK